MIQLMDPLGLRLQGEARRSELRASMQAAHGARFVAGSADGW